MKPDSQRGVATTPVALRGGSAMPLIILLDHEGAFIPRPRGELPTRLGLNELNWLAAASGHPGAELIPDALDATVCAHLEEAIRTQTGSQTYVGQLADAEPAADSHEASEYEGDYRMATPTALAVTTLGFDFLHHTGGLRLRVDALELTALTVFTKPTDVAGASVKASTLTQQRLDGRQFRSLVHRLVGVGLIVPLATDAAHAHEGRATREFRRSMDLQRQRTKQVAMALGTHRNTEATREEGSSRRRVRVVPVNSEGNPLLSLGMLMTYAAAFEGGRLAEYYQFLPDWADQTVPSLTPEDPPSIFLFSNYIWSHAWNVIRSAEVKERNPESLTIHGGPNTPKYDADIQEFFTMNPHVDITVHGEGEATLAHLLDVLKDSISQGSPDRSVLRDVPGISFRNGDSVTHTGERERIADLDTIPSPYGTGLFDSVGDVEITLMTIETNRGCPYGCTYCDWGSATLSRIRKFDLERIYQELEWCARHKVNVIFNADANFGIFSRDVEIARRLVDLKQQYGYPRVFESSYAKNTVKHLREIIEILAAGDVLSTGTLSLQTMDSETLDAINRSNIKVEKYDDLAVEFGKQGLPLVIELMMGLPGSTVSSFLGDLQQCIDREVKARVNPTEVLMNSPMNAPDYRRDHEISTLRPVNQDWSENNRTRKKALVVSTSSFTQDEYDRMERYRIAFLLCENFAVLRQVSRFVRQETGLREIDFYVRLVDDARSSSNRWPTIAFVFDVMVNHMVPPASWRLFIEEIRIYLTTQLGILDDSALDTVLRVQLALIPSRERSYPETSQLEHDFEAWHAEILRVKRSEGGDSWTESVPRLVTYQPASFTVDDPQQVSILGLGMSLIYDPDSDWELSSPVARPMRYRHMANS